jgi:hypothetical protein
VKFYGVGDLLVRRRPRVPLDASLELWNGHEWTPYTDVTDVLRHGRPLTEAQALSLLHDVSARTAPVSPLSEHDARVALRTPRKPR